MTEHGSDGFDTPVSTPCSGGATSRDENEATGSTDGRDTCGHTDRGVRPRANTGDLGARVTGGFVGGQGQGLGWRERQQ